MATTLAHRIPDLTIDLQGYLQAVHAFPLLSADEEHELAVRYREDDDLDAAWRLVTSHLRYVVKIARGYRGYGLPQEDLIQEGNIGLMKAVKGFDPSLGVRLVSYAVHWIRNEIHEFVLRNWRIVKVATTKAQRKLFFNIRGAKKRLGWLGREEAEVVAEDLGVRPEEVVEMEQRLHAKDAAFDGAPGSDDDGRPAPAALLEDRRYEPGELVEEAEWTEFATNRVSTALDTLDARSRDIVTRRWLAEPKAKLRELAEEYGVSAERVRQIEAEAFAALRDAVERHAFPKPEQLTS
jgi:RNA polymerase sigma-32 factor